MASTGTVSATAANDHDRVRPDRARLTHVCVVVPALNEERSVARVVREIRATLPGVRVAVVDDGSTDGTVAEAAAAGAAVVSLPVNVGIGGAVQAGYRYALHHGFEFSMQIDGDGQHDPAEALRLLDVVMSGDADIAQGSRWLGRGGYVAPTGRRIGMRILAAMVRWRTGRTFTDTTSGFRALGPLALDLFAHAYPVDFPEVESLVHATRAGLRVEEVPVRMTEREHGRSSIAGPRSAYYMARVVLALLVGGLQRTEGP